MIPVLTPAEMAAVDREAPQPIEVLVARAAAAVAAAAVDELGGTYARRVIIVAGPGNNGEDGRVAARLLDRRGVRCRVIDAASAPEVLDDADLVIDAAFGTGLRDDYVFPATTSPVLSVDIASGIDGLTGAVRGRPPMAVRTVTFAALKPGLVLGSGPLHCGAVDVIDIGLDVSRSSIDYAEPSDVTVLLPQRARDSHKWRNAVRVIAGSPGMSGAAALASAAAMRGGAGYVQLSSPGGRPADAPIEAVVTTLPEQDWAPIVIDEIGRFTALAIGPGLGRDAATLESVRAVVSGSGRVPCVIDGDGLRAFGPDSLDLLRGRSVPAVLTPHDAEFAAVFGAAPAEDRVASAREAASASGSVVLLKGPTTVIADPAGRTVMVRAGDQRLATAGTGDVLCGLVGAALASGAPALAAAAASAQLHGDASTWCPSEGMVASDLLGVIADVRSSLYG